MAGMVGDRDKIISQDQRSTSGGGGGSVDEKKIIYILSPKG